MPGQCRQYTVDLATQVGQVIQRRAPRMSSGVRSQTRVRRIMMKRLAVMMLAFASSLAAADYSGIWNGKGTVQSARYPGGVPYTVQMTILQAGNSFNGTLKVGNNTPLQVSNGSVSGTGLSFRASLASFQVTE